MIYNTIGYSYNDLTIIPAEISSISSRSECNPFYDDEKLPIFASCMSTVVDENNIDIWEKNYITPIVPRNIKFDKRLDLMYKGKWVAMSLEEFENFFINDISEELKLYNGDLHVCVDIANGHMRKLYDVIVRAKQEAAIKYNYKIIVMTGNIANPYTYKWICEHYSLLDSEGSKKCMIDYIRLSIGSGSQCTTSSNTGIHYPIASLIDECYKIKRELLSKETETSFYASPPKRIQEYSKLPKLVADGGIRNYDHVIKALALGADYVMIGGLFAAMYESASPLILGKYNHCGYLEYFDCDYVYTSEEKKRKDIKNRNLYKECYGMSTKRAQELIDPTKKKKTAEGKHSMIKVQNTINQWTENMIDYLKSTMSYCGSKTINEFIGRPQLIVNSPGAINAVNK